MSEGTALAASDAPAEGKRARRSADYAKRVLDAAVVEFSDHGFDAARIADIARRGGLSTGAIYSRWRDKRELFLGAVNHAMSQRLAGVDAARQQTNQIAAALGADQLRSIDDEARGLCLEACVLARRDDALRDSISETLNAEADALSKLVAEGKAAGIFDRSLPTEIVVLCCQALSIGTPLALSISENRITDEDAKQWDELIRRVVSSWAPREFGTQENE